MCALSASSLNFVENSFTKSRNNKNIRRFAEKRNGYSRFIFLFDRILHFCNIKSRNSVHSSNLNRSMIFSQNMITSINHHSMQGKRILVPPFFSGVGEELCTLLMLYFKVMSATSLKLLKTCSSESVQI